LENSVPSSTGLSSVSAETRAHAQELRKYIESLDNLLRSRGELLEMANDLAEMDNIQPRVMKAASGFERWAEVEPAMFEDILDEEISKYDKFLQRLRENKEEQAQVLTNIEVIWFLPSNSVIF
jgi:programmed cell death 6-interacting protein